MHTNPNPDPNPNPRFYVNALQDQPNLTLTLTLSLTLHPSPNVLTSRRPLWLSGRQASKVSLAKEPKDVKAAKKRKINVLQEARRKEKSVDMNKGRLAEDEATLEAQRLGVMNDVKLWQPSDGTAIKGKLHYTREDLRNALTAKGKADYARTLPRLVLAVKDAYGWAS